MQSCPDDITGDGRMQMVWNHHDGTRRTRDLRQRLLVRLGIRGPPFRNAVDHRTRPKLRIERVKFSP
jgi:hypothetical protein